jgi:hypothetical protein
MTNDPIDKIVAEGQAEVEKYLNNYGMKWRAD